MIHPVRAPITFSGFRQDTAAPPTLKAETRAHRTSEGGSVITEHAQYSHTSSTPLKALFHSFSEQIPTGSLISEVEPTVNYFKTPSITA